ncbi:ankyrin repeat domain-containing protein 16 isoform X1 [Histomonas meleagridis]|uniref:ankyrin repeat domain-containing protein 16 isoform X1 n=1 Tax=Histomonas meleagridis TaxID=135588 RepID=UPI00355979D4|nr:ankyrin repeat domain-containing protein 16 isoform X1 [Histomonas meleagridis]KAH0803124.1 ankyrin repeat domain-containing protein 16 isoform X1 [Histomonas meleagridis]
MIELLFRNDKKIELFTPNLNGWNPIHFAAQMENVQMLELLYDKGSKYINKENNFGQTPFEVSIIWGKEDSFFFFLDLSDNEIQLNHVDNYGNAPLHLAIKNMQLTFVQTLLQFQETDLNLKNKKGQTPLHIAIENWSEEMFHDLIATGECKLSEKDNDGLTPLLLAVLNGQLEFVKTLVGKNANCKDTDNKGNTALHLAARLMNPDMLKFLLSTNHFEVNSYNNEGKNFADIAFRYKRQKVIEYIRQTFDFEEEESKKEISDDENDIDKLLILIPEEEENEEDEKEYEEEEKMAQNKQVEYEEESESERKNSDQSEPEEEYSDIDRLIILVPEEEEEEENEQIYPDITNVNQLQEPDDDLETFEQLEKEAFRNEEEEEN